MDRPDREKLYTLLSKFYPHAKILKDQDARSAWGLILQRYEYPEVKEALLSYAAKNKFPPDISDLVAGLKAAPAETEIATNRERIDNMKKLYSKMKGVRNADSV